MSEVGPVHDHFFRYTFGREELAADVLQHYLPAGVAVLLDPDPASLRRRNDTFVDPDLRGLAADLVYEARLRDGSPVVVYVLFEHKTEPEPLVALQLLRYQVRLWEADLRAGRPVLPIIPVVVYHGERRWQVARTHGALFGGPEALRPYWPEFRYELLDLSRYEPAAMYGAVLTQIVLRALRGTYDPGLREELPGLLDLYAEVIGNPSVQELLKTVTKYLADASQSVEWVDVERAAQGRRKEVVEMVMTAGEKLRQEGRRQGREEGERRGLLAGIELGLDLKFGADGLALMPEVARIEDLATLRAVRDAIRPARTVDDIRAVYWRAAA